MVPGGARLVFVCLACAVLAVAARPAAELEMLVFSGTQNPTIHLDSETLGYVLDHCVCRDPAPEPWWRLGYSGFAVRTKPSAAAPCPVCHVYGRPAVEARLLDLCVSRGAVSHAVAEHVASEIERLASRGVMRSLQPARGMADLNMHTNMKQNCTLPIVGPNSETVYDPDTDDCGFFVSHQGENNCYNYGTDIATDTFAKPGRGTGHMFDENTCDSVLDAAKRDGLTWYGKDLPPNDPPTGHYVALFIWPNANFHWIRKDTDTEKHWSHKPGGTEVRDVDNRGEKITDPSQSDFSPWTEFCGYLWIVPSNVTIS